MIFLKKLKFSKFLIYDPNNVEIIVVVIIINNKYGIVFVILNLILYKEINILLELL